MATGSRTCYSPLHWRVGNLLSLLVWGLFAVGVFCQPSWAQTDSSAGPLELGHDANGGSETIVRGQELRILLKENPTTGYTWHVVRQDSALLEMVKKDFLAPGGTMAGAPGKALFVFKAIAAGETELVLGYYRSWEGSDTAVDHFRIRLRIE